MNGDAGDRPHRPVLEALDLLLEPGGVAELRAIRSDGRVSSGYFDDTASLAGAVEVLDAAGECSGIYVTLNPVHPALHSRRANRVKSRLDAKDATTADADVLCRRWLPIDVDPVRPSGVSADADEPCAARGRVDAIREYLAGQGWPAPVVADSGNGGHLLYRVDLPNDGASTELVRSALAALDARFSDGVAKVDTGVYNAARIWKVYGTVGRKGDSTRDRPHRRSAIIARPFEPGVVPEPLLRALAGEQRPPGPSPPAARRGGIDLSRWLSDHGIAVASEKPWQGGTLYALAQCPFSDAHADGAYAVQFGNGAIHAGCKHDRCGGGRQRWPELRERFEPGPPAPSPGPVPTAAPGAEAGPDPAVGAAATEVLEHGDPVRYFLDCFERDHVGDETLARCLVASIASQAVRNTKGLHVYVTGESGKGKSSGMTAMLRQVPEEYRLAERLSNKALYYSDDISPGTVLLLDDIALSEELLEVLKEATSRFTEPVRMRSVDNERKVRRYTIPERCAWWLANVSALYDDQVLNRMLTCWVDDSEAQDREVFRRRMAAVARGDDGADDRFDLAVCREIWRQLRRDGPVAVRVPFADRIRMASVRNRRNPEVLLDLVRAHALVFRYQRPAADGDGAPAIVATEEDFREAARLFADLHAAGGSLGEKFDRNEDAVLALAARFNVESFTLRDVQRWTGWPYQKCRRLLVGYARAGARYPGLLDKSPALSVLDRTVSDEDGEGRAATRRQLVFLFDSEVHRETRASGLAWLEDEPLRSRGDRCTHGVHIGVQPGVHPENDGAPLDPGEEAVSSDPTTTCTPDVGTHGSEPGASAGAGDRRDPGPGVHSFQDRTGVAPERESDSVAAAAICTPGSTPPRTPHVHRAQSRPLPDPRRFTPTGAPLHEPCSACGRQPSFHRERRGGAGRLCRACFARAVERERRRCPPLPAVIDPGAMRRAAAEIGRCGVCGLEAARWHGAAGRLCDACYRREVRQGIEAGREAAGAG